MFFLASRGYRCIAHDRGGHGRSSQPWQGNDLDTYPDDLAAPVEALDLKDAVGGREDLGRRARVLLAAEHDGRLPRLITSALIKAFSETDLTEDLKKFDVPTLILHCDDDQIVPIGASAMLSSRLVKNAKLVLYKGAPHGMCTTLKDRVNADLLAFLKA